MIALGIRYLTKYAVATDLARQRAEWPPHPGRVFLAMAAAHFETGAEPEERIALEWLERAAPPAILATGADERSLVRSYVPVNDEHGGIVRRSRQDRAFPRVRPHSDTVYLIWKEAPVPTVRDRLQAICHKVTRVGHSSSAVQMWVVPEGQEPEPNLVPSGGTEGRMLRVASEGTMDSLVAAFNADAILAFDALSAVIASAKGKEKSRLKLEMQTRFGANRPRYRRPELVRWENYAEPQPEPVSQTAEGPFDTEFIVLAKADGPVLGLEPTLDLTGALRNAAMKAAGTSPPEWLTGHTPEGVPTTQSHVAFFPLPYVGEPYGDGHVMGLGIALPRNVDGDETRYALGRLLFDLDSGEERPIRLWNRYWEWTVRRQQELPTSVALDRQTWTGGPGGATQWASVTPVVLHHYPKKNRAGDVERILMEAFVTAGFPSPIRLRVHSVSLWKGSGGATSIPPFSEGGPALCRYQTHVAVEFDRPVKGPMLVGRGRFRGYGLFRPRLGGWQ